MDKIKVRLDIPGGPYEVGTLAEQGGRIYFEYDGSFLARGLELSPFHLPLRPGIFDEVWESGFFGLPGLFYDSLPDGWGLWMMDRAFRKAGIAPEDMSALARLRYLGERAMGALTYHPASDIPPPEADEVDLGVIAAQARRIYEGSSEEVLDALLVTGGSPGGARPKAVVGVSPNYDTMVAGTQEIPAGWSHYLVKFGAEVDHEQEGAAEAAYAEMARQAGLTMADTHLFTLSDGTRCFGSRRFDRREGARVHVHSLCGLLHASHRFPSLDYRAMLQATYKLTRDVREVREAFRRMAFNVFAHNRDDHTKNTAFLMEQDGSWCLAPAFDLTYSTGPRSQHTMSVNGEGQMPTMDDMLAVAEAVDLEAEAAREDAARVIDAVKQWPAIADRFGAPRDRTRQIEERLRTVRERAGGHIRAGRAKRNPKSSR